VQAATIAAVAQGRRPEKMKEDEAVVFDFWQELESNRFVSDHTWSRALAAFGEQGTVDLIGVLGYYAFLAMTMNAARTEVPHSSAPPLEPLSPPSGVVPHERKNP
jgi:4-carboxymuconolactone decarboxylase